MSHRMLQLAVWRALALQANQHSDRRRGHNQAAVSTVPEFASPAQRAAEPIADHAERLAVLEALQSAQAQVQVRALFQGRSVLMCTLEQYAVLQLLTSCSSQRSGSATAHM